MNLLACGSHCSDCTDSTTCNTGGCDTDYTLTSGSCDPDCSDNCASCTTPGTCETCNSYYHVDGTTCSGNHFLRENFENEFFLACGSHCSDCIDSTTCNTGGCDTDYTLTSGECKPDCSDNCASCTTPGTCGTCNDYYFLDGSACTGIECFTNYFCLTFSRSMYFKLSNLL